MAKVGGLYREEQRDNQPIQITKMTVALDYGNGQTDTETRQIDPPPEQFADGESRALPEEAEG